MPTRIVADPGRNDPRRPGKAQACRGLRRRHRIATLVPPGLARTGRNGGLTMATQTQTVLVVDDEPRIREVLQFALEKEGYKVATAPDGSAALAKVAEGGVDLMVLDVLMPELD